MVGSGAASTSYNITLHADPDSGLNGQLQTLDTYFWQKKRVQAQTA